MISARRVEGAAEEVGRHLAEMALRMRTNSGPNCLISGGEPTVALIEQSRRGKGGRNQQLALAAFLNSAIVRISRYYPPAPTVKMGRLTPRGPYLPKTSLEPPKRGI